MTDEMELARYFMSRDPLVMNDMTEAATERKKLETAILSAISRVRKFGAGYQISNEDALRCVKGARWNLHRRSISSFDIGKRLIATADAIDALRKATPYFHPNDEDTEGVIIWGEMTEIDQQKPANPVARYRAIESFALGLEAGTLRSHQSLTEFELQLPEDVTASADLERKFHALWTERSRPASSNGFLMASLAALQYVVTDGMRKRAGALLEKPRPRGRKRSVASEARFIAMLGRLYTLLSDEKPAEGRSEEGKPYRSPFLRFVDEIFAAYGDKPRPAAVRSGIEKAPMVRMMPIRVTGEDELSRKKFGLELAEPHS
jgi:hypothetical protein